jgi:hypothetical protein
VMYWLNLGSGFLMGFGLAAVGVLSSTLSQPVTKLLSVVLTLCDCQFVCTSAAHTAVLLYRTWLHLLSIL